MYACIYIYLHIHHKHEVKKATRDLYIYMHMSIYMDDLHIHQSYAVALSMNARQLVDYIYIRTFAHVT